MTMGSRSVLPSPGTATSRAAGAAPSAGLVAAAADFRDAAARLRARAAAVRPVWSTSRGEDSASRMRATAADLDRAASAIDAIGVAIEGWRAARASIRRDAEAMEALAAAHGLVLGPDGSAHAQDPDADLDELMRIAAAVRAAQGALQTRLEAARRRCAGELAAAAESIVPVSRWAQASALLGLTRSSLDLFASPVTSTRAIYDGLARAASVGAIAAGPWLPHAATAAARAARLPGSTLLTSTLAAVPGATALPAPLAALTRRLPLVGTALQVSGYVADGAAGRDPTENVLADIASTAAAIGTDVAAAGLVAAAGGGLVAVGGAVVAVTLVGVGVGMAAHWALRTEPGRAVVAGVGNAARATARAVAGGVQTLDRVADAVVTGVGDAAVHLVDEAGEAVGHAADAAGDAVGDAGEAVADAARRVWSGLFG